MQKKFVTNLALLVFLNLLIKPFWIFGIDREVQNLVGAEVYGKYYALLNFSFLLNILLDLGITNFNNRNISQHRHLVAKHFSGIVVLRFMLAGGYIVFSMVAGWFIGYAGNDLHLLILLLANQFLISFILYMRSNLTGLHLFVRDSIISVTDRFLMIIICGYLLWGHNYSFKIEWFIYAQTIAYLITALLALIFMRGKFKFEKLTWRPAFYVTILKKSFPFALLILLMTFYSRIDSIMLERLLPDGALQSGIYAQAYRILDAVNMFAFLFATLLLPMFSHMIKRNEPLDDLLKLSFSLIAVPAIILVMTAQFFQTQIMTLLYHEHANYSAPVFGVLMIGFFSMATTYIFGTLLTANGSMRELNMMAAAGMLLNVTLNLIFIPVYKAYGASLAGFLTQTITAIIQVYISVKIFKLKFKANIKIILVLVA
jgi:O-antigen/teichoic acid export membrane protein